MKLEFKVKDIREHINFWLTLFQSGSKITDRERSVLTEILIKRDELSRDGIKEPFLTKLLFDNDRRKEYCSILSISTYTFANALSSMKEKGILEDDYSISSTMLFEDELNIRFKYDSK